MHLSDLGIIEEIIEKVQDAELYFKRIGSDHAQSELSAIESKLGSLIEALTEHEVWSD